MNQNVQTIYGCTSTLTIAAIRLALRSQEQEYWFFKSMMSLFSVSHDNRHHCHASFSIIVCMKMCLSTKVYLQEWSQTQNLISYTAVSAKFSQCQLDWETSDTFSQNLAVHDFLRWRVWTETSAFWKLIPYAGASCAYVFPTCEAHWCDAYDWSRRAGWQNHCSPCWWSRVQRIQWHQRAAKAQTHGNQKVKFIFNENLTLWVKKSHWFICQISNAAPILLWQEVMTLLLQNHLCTLHLKNCSEIQGPCSAMVSLQFK